MIAAAPAADPTVGARRGRQDLLAALTVILVLIGVAGYANAMPLGMAEDDLEALFAEVWDHLDDASGNLDSEALLGLAHAAVEDARLPAAPGPLAAPEDAGSAQEQPRLVDVSQAPAAGTAAPEVPEGSPTPSVGGTSSIPTGSEPRISSSDPIAPPGQSPTQSSPHGSVESAPANAAPVRGTPAEVTASPEGGPVPPPVATLVPDDLPTPTVGPTLPFVQPTPTLDVIPTVSAPTATALATATAPPDPTSTPRATATPRPTFTPTPTATPVVPPLGPTATPLPSGLSCGDSGGVCVTGSVRGVRVLVVDDQGEILQVWSNTDAPLELVVRIGSANGPRGTLTEDIEASYARIASRIPPGARGLVYVGPTP